MVSVLSYTKSHPYRLWSEGCMMFFCILQ